MPRNIVHRPDGKLVNVVRKQGHLFVCATGCCCGDTTRKYAPVPTQLYHNEWERRKLRNKVHMTNSGCLGPCPLANVALLIFDTHHIWFHSVNSEAQVVAIYDYIDQMLALNSYLPPPPELAAYTFTAFTWDGHQQSSEQTQQRLPAAATSVAADASPAILFLSHADTDLLTLRTVISQLPADFPEIRVANPAALQTQEDVDTFLHFMLPQVEIVIVRLLGDRSSFAYGIERLTAWAQQEDKWLVCLPGTDTLDPELMATSTVGVPVAHEVLAYLQSGGVVNYENCLNFLCDHLLTTGFGFHPPSPQPGHGIYYPGWHDVTAEKLQAKHRPERPTIGILFYRAHYLSGNTEFVDTLVQELEAAGANALPVFTNSLKETAHADTSFPLALTYFTNDDEKAQVDAIITTMSFALGQTTGEDHTTWDTSSFSALNVPVLQAIAASNSRGQWEISSRGMTPLDTAMNVALPEFDGRIITVPISFKETIEEITPDTNQRGQKSPVTLSRVSRYRADPERVRRVVGQALRLANLRRKSNAEKRIAIVLTNSPAKAARIGNAVGLDAPASLIHLLHALQQAGYTVENIPEHGDELIHALIDRCSYDTELLSEDQLAQAAGSIPADDYKQAFAAIPSKNQSEIQERWGAAPGEAYVHNNAIVFAGLSFGNVFVALQPPRGYGMDPNAIYHTPDLAPTHHYYAFYHWLRAEAGWNTDAIVHLGKHGTIEWLPGKSVGLSQTCYPDLLLDNIPVIYPFIINNPGEGAQAKRRAHAVIIDHLIPPMTSAGAYGALAELAMMVDEYYQLEGLDPSKLPALQRQIWEKIISAHLDEDLKVMMQQDHGDHIHEWDEEMNEDGTPATLSEMRGKDFAHLLEDIDGYLCELTGAQIRNGLHILGNLPNDEKLTDLLFSLCRLPNIEIPGIRDALAQASGIPLSSLLDIPGRHLTQSEQAQFSWLLPFHDQKENFSGTFISAGDALAALENCCHSLLTEIQAQHYEQQKVEDCIAALHCPDDTTAIEKVLSFICDQIMPRLQQVDQEITHILKALKGEYIPAGPSGSPTRGMVHILPTGRNFYGLDPRAIPSQAAWEVGTQLADALVERHRKETGNYPESVGISVWGTSALRTQGDDIAQIFALMGVRPQWHAENRRIAGIELIPLQELGRPRIDVVSRISGFFRDAFPHIINLLDEAVHLVAHLDEPLDQNYVKRHIQADIERYRDASDDEQTSQETAYYRIFGSKPGAYGAGILPLIDERNWHDVTDFAEAYVNWGGYAYTRTIFGQDARSAFRTTLARVTVATKNQDNREHDIFDSDDYLQFHGGMIATIQALTGKRPTRYIGDTADPQNVRVRDLQEEALRVFRSRVVNPKWLASMREHGYKGGLELSATMDYIFGYDATSDIVNDWMYERVAQSYVLESETQDFLRTSNPWALRDIATRLFEAHNRGLWKEPDAKTLEALRDVLLQAEADIEQRNE